MIYQTFNTVVVSGPEQQTVALNVHQTGVLQLLSHETLATFLFVINISSEIVSVMGVVTNVINIVVFVRLGLRETTSISMLSLAVSDLLLMMLALWSNLLYIPQLEGLGLPIRYVEIRGKSSSN